MVNSPPVVTSQKVEQLKSYIAANKATCNECGSKFFWCSTPRGKRIPIDFPDQLVRPNRTHRLVLGYKDGIWDGTCEAWPHDGSSATHTTHLETCTERNRS